MKIGKFLELKMVPSSKFDRLMVLTLNNIDIPYILFGDNSVDVKISIDTAKKLSKLLTNYISKIENELSKNKKKTSSVRRRTRKN